MKKCSDCNCEMIDDCKLVGQKRFEVGFDTQSYIFLSVPTGEKMKGLGGMTFDKTKKHQLKARMCPKCGKIELYAELEK